MTRLDFLTNLNDAQDEYIEEALSLLESKVVSIKQKPARRVFRRVVTGLIAAIILLLSLFAVAMAASPEFREAVFNFFHIRTEDVTEHSPVENHELPIEESNVSENDVQIHVTVTRVRVPANGSSVNGLFLICSDEIEYNQGNRYDVYTQQGGELVKLESHAVHVTETRFGKTFRFDFEWASDGKNTAIGYVRTPDGSSDDGDYRIQFLTGHPYEALVLLTNESGGLYPLLMDLNTSALTDFAASIDMNRVGGITAWGYSNNGRLLDLSMSGDLTRLVFRNPEGTVFYGNLTTGEMINISDLVGEDMDSACLAGDDTIACRRIVGGIFDEEKAAQYAEQFDGYDGTVDYGIIRFWRIPLDTLQPEQVGDLSATALSNPEAIWHGTEREEMIGAGFVFPSVSSNRYLLDINAEHHVFVTDLACGERAEIEGFLWPEAPWPRIECQGSPCGDRLLISEYDKQGELFRLTVLDFPRLLWITIDRENAAGGIEHWRTWFDNDRIMIDSDSIDEYGRSTGESWYYIYDISKYNESRDDV